MQCKSRIAPDLRDAKLSVANDEILKHLRIYEFSLCKHDSKQT